MKRILMMIAVFLAVGISTEPVQAAGLTFSVSSVQSINQVDKTKTYFDVRVMPKEVSTFQVKLTNLTDQPIQVESSVGTAQTSGSGNVWYTSADSRVKNAPFKLENVLQGESVISLQPHETKLAKYTLTMPANSFRGVLAGAIKFSDAATVDTQSEFTNRFVYVLGVVLHQGEAVKKADVSFGASWVKQKSESKLTILNKSGVFLNKAKITQTIYQAGKKIGTETSFQNGQIAPFSSFKVTLKKSLPVGNYEVATTVYSKGQKWETQRPLSIK
jgi:hypothetical protein